TVRGTMRLIWGAEFEVIEAPLEGEMLVRQSPLFLRTSSIRHYNMPLDHLTLPTRLVREDSGQYTSGLGHKTRGVVGLRLFGTRKSSVYEFLPNGELRSGSYLITNETTLVASLLINILKMKLSFNFESHKQQIHRSRGKTLNWKKRSKIIKGTAEGMIYLHENSKIIIIHRDIKASNLLLDSKHRAEIADFGLARSFQDDKSHISTAIAGTLGYMAPEYLSHGQLTEKVDVYSYGVLLIEIVTRRQNNMSKTSDYSDILVTEVSLLKSSY
ncbi:hypothetical protein IFM89_016827, partial [Coptis chinensis]